MTRAGRTGFLAVVSSCFLLGMSGPAAPQLCDQASHEVSALPFADSDSTTSEGDDYDLAADGNCAGGGTQAAGTGTGPDVVYRIDVDVTCNLNVRMDPTFGSNDLALYVVTDCADLAATCVGVDDAGGAGAAEDVAFTANSGTPYFIIVDGSGGDQGAYDLAIGETSSTGCSLISLPPPDVEVNKIDELHVDLGGDGFVNPGDTIRYTVRYTNTAGTAAGIMFNDTPGSNTSLVVGSVTSSDGSVTSGNGEGDTSVAVDASDDPVPTGGSRTIRFQVTVDSPLATQVENQGTISGNFSPVPTNDPDTPEPGDPTRTAVFPAQMSGASCEVSAQCESGFCADGVCCESACDVAGEVCDLPHHVGICTIACPCSDFRAPAPSASHTALLISLCVLAAIGLLALYRRRTVAH